MKNIILILLLAIIQNICFGQVNYRGIVLEKGFEYFEHGGIINMKINLIMDNDTTYAFTDENGNFYFNIDQTKDLHLFARKRHYKVFDTIVKHHLLQNIEPNTLQIIDTFRIDLNIRKRRKSYVCYNAKTAISDIKDSTMFILLPGGYAGTNIIENDTVFEKKYNIEYKHLGCVRSSCDNELEYNKQIFKYLDKVHGSEWRRIVRNDVVGINE